MTTTTGGGGDDSMRNGRKQVSHEIVDSIKTVSNVVASSGLYLPYDCWESVLKFVIEDKSCLKSVSVVSKQFLSITNHLRCSFPLTILNPTLTFLSRILQRFPNLTSIDLSHFRDGDLDDLLLLQISRFPFKFLTSLKITGHYKIPANGLRAFSQNITSLTCSSLVFLSATDLFLIAECFPFLEELDIGYCNFRDHTNLFEGLKTLLFTLSKLRKINLSNHNYINDNNIIHLFKNNKNLQELLLKNCRYITYDAIASVVREMPALRSFSFFNYSPPSLITSHFIDSLVSLKCLTCLDLYAMVISDELLYAIAMKALPLTRLFLVYCINYTYAGISGLLSKCPSIQHLDLRHNTFLNDQHVSELSLFLGDLVSVDLSNCSMLTGSALFALARSCPSLSDVRMRDLRIGMESIDISKFVVNHQLNSLDIGGNPLQNEHIIRFDTIFPNLETLDLSYCNDISEEGIGQVLMRCGNIRNLNLDHSSKVKLLGMKFEIPKLEVLNLSNIALCDETLYVISKSCCGILKLKLENSVDVTNKGVKYVVENCTQLREISLWRCDKVDHNVVVSMVLSRPSLRRIYSPVLFDLDDRKMKLLLNRYGCMVF